MKLADETYGQAWQMTIAEGPDINDEERGHWYSPTAVAQFIADEREACVALLEDNAKQCGEESIMRLILETNAAAIRARSNDRIEARP